MLLIPARTDTQYFHEYIYGKAEIRFLRGRLRFEDEDGTKADAAPFPSMVVIYRDGGRCEMKEKETLRIVLTEDQELELEFECSLRTFITVIAAAVKEVGLSNDKAAKLFAEIAQHYFGLNEGESK